MRMICIKNRNEIRQINVDSILAVATDDYLYKFYFESGDAFTCTCTKSLKETIAELPDSFVRINRNCIISKNQIRSVNLDKRVVVLSNKMELTVSTRRLKILKNLLLSESK